MEKKTITNWDLEFVPATCAQGPSAAAGEYSEVIQDTRNYHLYYLHRTISGEQQIYPIQQPINLNQSPQRPLLSLLEIEALLDNGQTIITSANFNQPISFEECLQMLQLIQDKLPSVR